MLITLFVLLIQTPPRMAFYKRVGEVSGRSTLAIELPHPNRSYSFLQVSFQALGSSVAYLAYCGSGSAQQYGLKSFQTISEFVESISLESLKAPSELCYLDFDAALNNNPNQSFAIAKGIAHQHYSYFFKLGVFEQIDDRVLHFVVISEAPARFELEVRDDSDGFLNKK